MKKWILLFVGFGLLPVTQVGANYLDDHLKKKNWHGLEVQWIEDKSTPIYDVIIKFQAGAITDHPQRIGETEVMFGQLTAGTTQYTQKEIAEHLEFFGTRYDMSVTHEYSMLQVRGLVKDILPTMQMVCHLFRRATFPQDELNKFKARFSSSKKNLPTQLGALAERAFRQVSLQQTPFSKPTDGTLGSIKNIQTNHLVEKLNFFNQKVSKKIFIVGPPEVEIIQHVFKNDCGWNDQAKDEFYGAEVKTPYKKPGNLVHLVSVKDANQAQIRIGGHLTVDQINSNPHHLRFASTFLGGGFTSQLVTELRVNRGLTYSAGAVAAGQKNYGRAVISTFTPNKSVVELLTVVKDVLDMSKQKYSDELLNRMKKFAKGNYLFSLETSSQFMNNLIYLDHVGRSYDQIYSYPIEVDKITEQQLKQNLTDTFNWDRMTIVIVGDPSIEKDLKKAGFKVKVHAPAEFL